MTIHPIGGASVALYITPAELKARGVRPEELSGPQAEALARQACAAAGLSLPRELEIEAFPGQSGLLLFARARRSPRIWYSFQELEPLLSAALALREAPEGCALYWCGGRWWLCLEDGEGASAALLAEFGRRERERPHLAAHLAEFGRTIFPTRALGELRRYAPARESQ